LFFFQKDVFNASTCAEQCCDAHMLGMLRMRVVGVLQACCRR